MRVIYEQEVCVPPPRGHVGASTGRVVPEELGPRPASREVFIGGSVGFVMFLENFKIGLIKIGTRINILYAEETFVYTYTYKYVCILFEISDTNDDIFL